MTATSDDVTLVVAAEGTVLGDEAWQALERAAAVVAAPGVPLWALLTARPERLVLRPLGDGCEADELARFLPSGPVVVLLPDAERAGSCAAELGARGVQARVVTGRKAKGALVGRTALLTRGGRDPLAARLEEAGARVLRFATTRAAPPSDPYALGEALAALDDFDWLVFLSQQAVRACAAALAPAVVDAARRKGLRLAAVGPATAHAAQRLGLQVDLVAGEHHARGLAQALEPLLRPGAKVLVPRAEEGREELVAALAAKGAEVTAVAAYRTVPLSHPLAARVAAALAAGDVDALAFTSPSAARSFCAQIRGAQKVAAFAIGPTTAEELRRLGFRHVEVASRYTGEGLVDAMLAYLGRREDEPSPQSLV